MADQGISIPLPPDALQTIVAGAVLNAITGEHRDTIIKAALQYLLTPKEAPGYYGRRSSPLEDAFNLALSSAATRICLDHIERSEEIKTKVRELAQAAFEKAFSEPEGLVRKMADALVGLMTGSGR